MARSRTPKFDASEGPYHPSIYPDLPEFGYFGVASETSSDGAESGFEERA